MEETIEQMKYTQELIDRRVEDILGFVYDMSLTVEKLADSTKNDKEPMSPMERLREILNDMISVLRTRRFDDIEKNFGVIR